MLNLASNHFVENPIRIFPPFLMYFGEWLLKISLMVKLMTCNCSQVITEFCKSIGADAKQRQGLIRLAKKNGERLGFLA